MAWHRRSLTVVLVLLFSLLAPLDRYADVSLATDAVPDAFEMNDSSSMATAVQLDQTYQATVHSLEDVDFYKLTPTKNGRYHFTVKSPESSNVQVVAFDADMQPLTFATTGSGATQDIEFAGVAGKVHVLKITAISVGSYSLRLSEVAAEYQYDAANRLTEITVQRGTHRTQTKLLYDANGNLVQKTTTVTEVE